jgi:hypothetical protein
MPILPGLIANSGGTQPSPPLNPTLTTVNTSTLTANWTAPAYAGKHALSNYIVSLFDSSGTLINSNQVTVAFPSTTATISGLATATQYSIRVRVSNAIGVDSNLSVSSGNRATASPPPPPPPPPPCPPAGTVVYETACSGGIVGQAIADGNCGVYGSTRPCGQIFVPPPSSFQPFNP